MRALQAQLVGAEEREASFLMDGVPYFSRVLGKVGIFCPIYSRVLIQQCIAFRLAQFKVLPRGGNVRHLKIVNRHLQLVCQPDLSIFGFVACLRVSRPNNVVDRVHILEERRNTLESICQFGGNWEQINSATLLEISELRNFQSVEHHLPANAPGTESR